MGTRSIGWSSRLIVCVLLFSSPARAQEFPFQSFAALRQKFPADTSTWGSQQYLDYTKALGSVLVDIVWQFQHPAKPKPPVTSRLSAPRNPPVWNGSTIVLPVSYVHDMMQLGFMLGRDVYIKQWRSL